MSQPTDDLITQLKSLTPAAPVRTALDAAFAAGRHSTRKHVRYWQACSIFIAVIAMLPIRPASQNVSPPVPVHFAQHISAPAMPPPSPDSAFLLTRTLDLSAPAASSRRTSGPPPSPRAFDPAS